ncbi:AI-2E family transporter [Luteimicrobium subarcticum]|nr:AI-2E family transporter [Luteimicrobium subarcticum]
MADARPALFSVPLDGVDGAGRRTGGRSPRTPPPWLWRALLMTALAVFVAAFAWFALRNLEGLLVDLLLAFFLTLVLEPTVVWLVRHGWRRTVAAGTALGGFIVAVCVVAVLFGRLFVEQLVGLFEALPHLYEDLTQWASDELGVQLPASEDVVHSTLSRYGNDVASGVWLVGTGLVGVIFSLATILLIVYYLSSAGPRFRRTVCSWLPQQRQSEMLRLWDITQIKVSDFVTSRVVLAALSSFFTWIFLTIIHTPYAVPLALFTGVVSQFVPTIGTYIGGALPTLVALTAQGVGAMVAVLVFIIVYQQIENYVFSPKVSARALEMNPAVSFVVVIAFGAVFGAIGAFLALPIAATIQAAASTYLQRHELVDSASLYDPEPTSRSLGTPDDGHRGSRRRRANHAATIEAARTVDERIENGIE